MLGVDVAVAKSSGRHLIETSSAYVGVGVVYVEASDRVNFEGSKAVVVVLLCERQKGVVSMIPSLTVYMSVAP